MKWIRKLANCHSEFKFCFDFRKLTWKTFLEISLHVLTEITFSMLFNQRYKRGEKLRLDKKLLSNFLLGFAH